LVPVGEERDSGLIGESAFKLRAKQTTKTPRTGIMLR